MTRLFTADFSNGSLRQWERVLTRDLDAVGEGTSVYPSTGLYPVQVVSEGDCGYAARFELRTGDNPGMEPPPPDLQGGERTQLATKSDGWIPLGSTRWVAFSIKFGEGFTDYSADETWETLVGFKCSSDNYPGYDYFEVSPSVISFGWPLNPESDDYRSGYWYLNYGQQSTPTPPVPPSVDFTANYIAGTIPIAEMPLDVGEWQDIVMQIYFANDESGFVKLWRNGVAQTFMTSGTATFTGQTIAPGPYTTGVLPHIGIYRMWNTVATDVIYYKGYRIADSADSI